MATALLTGSDRITAAKNIRTELKAAFPGVKFSVRSDSFSNGCSIDVRWTDGPITKRVDEIVGKYQYGSFDGMTDCYNYNNKSAREWTDKHGGTKYAHCSRDISSAMVQRGIDAVAAKYGSKNIPTVADFEAGRANGSPMDGVTSYRWDWQSLIHQACSELEG